MIKKFVGILVIIIILKSCNLLKESSDGYSRFSAKRGFWRDSTKKDIKKSKSKLQEYSKNKPKRNYQSKSGTKKDKKNTAEEYIEQFKEIAIEEMHYCGIPASITLAQGLIESGNGNSFLAKEANNHFGVKCPGGWNGEKFYYDDDEPQECFRSYQEPNDSYKDHSEFLIKGKRYRFLFDIPAYDYKAWAKGLKQAGYATNPEYAEILIGLIEKYDLQSFVEENYDEQKTLAKLAIQFPKEEIHQKKPIWAELEIKKYGGRRFVIAKDGDTFFNISQRSGIKQSKLVEINNLQSKSLYIGQTIYLDSKLINDSVVKKVHVVKDGDTLYSITRQYEISLKDLCDSNNLDENSGIKIGQKLIIP